ncbi:uncharacterized protein [Gossypium hirsutum]|uniref:Uncharacterized protein n=1 Tax=Gossypium hirsutum TaxID=3635 RepID=A0ABM3ASM5_GOSHI|nr:uncharacterized protein LOC121222053 [Gossypium hirsutum]
MWQMFGGIVATGENAWAPSFGVLPSGVPMGDDAPNEGFGDSDEHSNENECIPPDEIPSNPSHEIPNRRKQTLGADSVSNMKEMLELVEGRTDGFDSIEEQLRDFVLDSLGANAKKMNELVNSTTTMLADRDENLEDMVLAMKKEI